jgi:hypothetical protein
LSRITLHFTLSDERILWALVEEFSLHAGVDARASGDVTLSVETDDRPESLWDVRATVAMFDDAAQVSEMP